MPGSKVRSSLGKRERIEKVPVVWLTAASVDSSVPVFG